MRNFTVLPTTGCPVLTWQALCSSHKICDCFVNAELINRNIVRKTVSIVSRSAQYSGSTIFPLVFFGLLTGSPRPVFEAHPGGETPFHPRAVLPGTRAPRTHPLSRKHLFQCPHDHGLGKRSDRRPQHLSCPLRWPDCTLSPSPCGEVRPACDPVDSDPRSRLLFEDDPHPLDRTLVAHWSLECVTTLGSRRSCPG